MNRSSTAPEEFHQSLDGKGLPTTGWTFQNDRRRELYSETAIMIAVVDDVDDVLVEEGLKHLSPRQLKVGLR
jgi:hypothetical protein